MTKGAVVNATDHRHVTSEGRRAVSNSKFFIINTKLNGGHSDAKYLKLTMDPAEEQAQELEVLESIYPDELTKLSDKQFVINVLLETETERKHRLALHVEYPDTYPEVIPLLKVRIGESLEEDEDDESEDYEDEEEEEDNEADDEHASPVHIPETVEFDSDDLSNLLTKVIEEAEENVGMPSVFALVSVLKDLAESMFIRKCEEAQKLHDEELQRREREEQKKFNGTKVTPQSFEEWRLRFREEMKIDERLEQRAKTANGGKLTGKEIFERGLAGNDDLVEGLENLQV
ncbi:unnamed protein product [Kuraishia capsulata CBS 1993]|uniref:RWD domain-containing protein n=1 Tax=Kuraishia capsulata CBS 1993 TaxID=1382522 RepID=W6MTX0_9ASCO|nr:uncharacterized protein KUCA_T00001257001 [Kuraishia capsulata CBS 1993]CDK25290.1 unnamed protein product [Kuraishia capsulata CBS 1993]